MAEDIFDEEKVEIGEEKAKDKQLGKPDLVEGLRAERDPSSVMVDPFAVNKSEAEDVVAKSLDQQISRMARETGKKLNAMPKDNVLIPKDKLNMNDLYVTVAINGYIMRIQRGKKVALPRPVIDLLISSGYGPTLVR